MGGEFRKLYLHSGYKVLFTLNDTRMMHKASGVVRDDQGEE